MKKIIIILGVILSTIALVACGKSNKNLANMTTKDSDSYVSIVWEGREYIPFCGVFNEERGKQIGIVNGDKNYQVYEYKNHSTDDWIISFYKSGEMDNSMLMKEINVDEIPKHLESEYEWSNK